MKIHVIHSSPNDEYIKSTLKLILNKLNKMTKELESLIAAVAKNTEVEESAIILLHGLKEKLDQAIADQNLAVLQELSDSIGAEADKLAAAVAANTPAAPEPPADPA